MNSGIRLFGNHGWKSDDPATWRYRYARPQKPATMMNHRVSIGGQVDFECKQCFSGSKVKIVAAFQSGDLGVTDNLDAADGEYRAVVATSDMFDYSETRE